MALTQETSLVYYAPLGRTVPMPVKAAVNVIRGAALTHVSGNVGPLTASQEFAGFADGDANNLDGSAGDKEVGVVTSGIVELAVADVDFDNLLDPVYASDSNTFTLSADGTVFVGKVAGIVGPSGGGTARVAFDVFNGVAPE